MLAYTEDVQKSIVLASFSSEDVEDKASLEESINFYRKERKSASLSSEEFSAEDLLDATIVQIKTFPAVIHGSKSTIAITIREIEEVKEINYF